MASGTYYYQEDDKSLASNQFVYVTNYSAEAGFDSDQYEFTFEDFGYYQEDGTEDEAESTDDEVSAYSASEDSGILENPISICSGTWKFTVVWIRQRIFPIRRSVIRPSLMEKMTSRLIA